jgi:hypothetical protein
VAGQIQLDVVAGRDIPQRLDRWSVAVRTARESGIVAEDQLASVVVRTHRGIKFYDLRVQGRSGVDLIDVPARRESIMQNELRRWKPRSVVDGVARRINRVPLVVPRCRQGDEFQRVPRSARNTPRNLGGCRTG